VVQRRRDRPGIDHDHPPHSQPEPLCTIECEVDEIVSLGQAPAGERRFVPLGRGRVSGLNGELIEGGVD
jgi:Protein of unknown function (DUF3237)